MFVLVKIDQPFAIFSTGLFAFNDINLNLLMKSLISQSESTFLEQTQRVIQIFLSLAFLH